MARTIALVVKKRKLGSPDTDWVEYWRSRSYEERLNALEEIRREYHQWKGDVPSEFPKVVRIVKIHRNSQ